jgi:phosphoserine phosphatase RsbU/P
MVGQMHPGEGVVSDQFPADNEVRSQRALAVLYAISIACRGQIAFQPIFQAIAGELQALFAYDACYLAVCDPQRPGIFRAALMIDEGLASYEEQSDYGSLTGTLVSTRTPLLFRDLHAEQSQAHRTIYMFGNTTKHSRSWMGVPLLFGEQTVGVISLQSYQANHYDQADVGLLQQVGNLAAVIIENANLSQNQRSLSTTLADQIAARNQQLSTLSELAAEMVRSRPPGVFMHDALDRISQLFSFDAAVIRLIDSTNSELVVAASRGMTEDYLIRRHRMPIAGTILGRVITENRAMAVGTEYAAGLRDHGLTFQSILSLPMRIGEQVLGGMTLMCADARQFDPEVIDVVLVLANQIAIVIENSRLFAERDRKVAELSALDLIAQAASTTHDLGTLLRQVHSALSDVLPLDAFSMVVYDPERKIITDGVSIDEGEEYSYWRRQIPPPDSLTSWVIQQQQPLHFANLDSEIEHYPQIKRHLVGSGRHAVSWLGVPLLNRAGSSIGLIAVQSYQPAMFSTRDGAFLLGVANQVALHVQNVVLLTHRERQIRELAAIGNISQAISAASSLDTMLRPIYNELQAVTDASSFVLIICEPERFRIRHSYVIDGGSEISQAWPNGRPPVGSLSAWILQHGKPVVFDDLHQQHEELRALGVQPYVYGSNDRPRSWAGVPLLDARMRPIGVLVIQDGRAYQYDMQTIEFLQQIASHISLGVQKAELYAESVTRVEQELTIARQIQSNLFPKQLPQVAGLQLAARCLPARETGGDFYDCLVLDHAAQGGLLALMIGDASGKSIPAAMLMAIARSVARSEARDHVEAAAVLTETNRLVASDVPRGSFVALCYATLQMTDANQWRVSLASAGQIAPILRRRSGRLIELLPAGPTMPLGIAAQIEYQVIEANLIRGDTIVFLTDGLIEARNTNREMFGFERVEQLVATHGNQSPAALVDLLINAVHEFIGTAPQHDDMTVMVVQIGV